MVPVVCLLLLLLVMLLLLLVVSGVCLLLLLLLLLLEVWEVVCELKPLWMAYIRLQVYHQCWGHCKQKYINNNNNGKR